MAVIKIEAKKDTRCTQTICLIRGDRRTQILRFGVNRFDGGVDLSDLAWVIKTVNANGVEDVFDPEAVEIGESRITVDWLVEGSVTDADGLAKYELNGLDTVGEDAVPVIWRGGTGTISLRADISPKFGESDGMTNIEKLILYVDGELQNVIAAGSAAQDAAARANRAADNVEDLSGAVERANTAAQRATDAAAAVEDLEGAVNRANSAAALATNGAMSADAAASMAYSAATRATEAAKNVENIEEATVAAYDAADDARMAAEVANNAGLPAAMIYGLRVKGETAKASGNPVSFLPDAGSLLQPVTVLEPQRAGSGDPYPGGGSKNLIDISSCRVRTLDDRTVTINGEIVTVTSSAIAIPQAQLFFLPEKIVLKAGTTYTIVLTSPVNFVIRIGFVTVPVGSLSKTFTPNEDITTDHIALDATEGQSINATFGICLRADNVAEYAPYSNIRPIIGYDNLGLNHTGKNLLSKVDVVGDIFLKSLVRLKAGETYTLSVQKMPDALYFSNEGGSVYFAMNTGSMSLTYTAETTGGYSVLARYGSGASVGYNMQLEHSSAPGAYEPYQGKLHTVQIDDTVYGGKVDWNTGKLVAEWGFKEFDGSESFGMSETGVVLYTPSQKPLRGSSGIGSHHSHVECGNSLNIHDALNATDLDTWTAFVTAQKAAGTPVQAAWKLATPIEIQLTPHIISAVEPEQNNTLYGDGTIEVEYVKPLHVSIEERVAAALAAAAE